MKAQKFTPHIIWQFIRLALISGIVFLLVAIVTFSLLGYLYRDQIKERFINQLNKGLQTQIFIRDISVNVLRSFPLASISLKDVVVLETPNGQDRDTLIAAQRVYFQFSVADLLKRNYTIRQMEVARASVNMKIFENEQNNYTFWVQDRDEPKDEHDLELQLQSVILNDLDFRFTDKANNHLVVASLGNARVSGNFTQNNYLLETRGDLFLEELRIDNAFMAGNNRLQFNFGFLVENNDVFTFRDGSFQFGSHAFLAQGSLDFSDELTYLDLKFSGDDLQLENFIKDLPPRYARYFEGYTSRGSFYFDAAISGTFSSVVNPYVSANFGIQSGQMIHRRANLKFEDVSFDAAFENGTSRSTQSSRLVVSDFYARLNQSELSGKGSVFNFDAPELDFTLFSDINADEWLRFLQIDTISRADGRLLVDLAFKGKLDESRTFKSHQFMASKIKGEVKAEDFSFAMKNDNLDYNSITADFVFNNNDIVVEHFSGKASGSDFEMKGYFRNVLPWLFLEDERLQINASLVSDRLNFNELLQHSVSESDTTYQLRLSDKIDFHFRADVGSLAFRRFEAQNVKGTLNMKDQLFYASDISLSTMKGHIYANGYINGQNDDYLIMGSDARFDNVDVYDLFYQTGNFGQQSISYENIRGRITADASFVSHWTPQLEVDWQTLETTADIKVEDGELINYKPMLALSRFIRVGDLNQVKFSTLENQIRIKDQNIIIPDMEINSNAINIQLSGEHTFENEIDYRLQVLLSDLLARRNRESRNPQEQYGDIIDDGLGRTTLFLRVTGNIDDPVFRYDTHGVREKLREDLRQERENLRQVFRTEFGLPSNDTLPDGSLADPTERQKQQEEIEEGEKGRFIIEWD